MPQLSKSTQTSLSEINMVPFVDVVLVLLIIFMITAPILQSGIEVDVPKTRTVKEINQERLVVTVDKAQRIYLGNEPINIHQLGSRIRSQLKNTQQGVFLRCDETVPFGSFAAVVDALRQSGINNISIVTEPITSASSPSPSPPARVPNKKHDHRRRQPARPKPPAIPRLLHHHARQPRGRHGCLCIHPISRQSMGRGRRRTGGHEGDFGPCRRNPHAQGIGGQG